MSKPAWAHLHLPRLRSGTTDNVISLKIPGQVIRYVPGVELETAIFRVHESGRQRCLREGVRNVHAWVCGDIRALGRQEVPEGWRKALYNPFKGPHFVDSETLEPLLWAERAILSGKDVWYQ